MGEDEREIRENIRALVAKLYPNAIHVEINVDSGGMDINARYKTITKSAYGSFKTISGDWIKVTVPAGEKI